MRSPLLDSEYLVAQFLSKRQPYRDVLSSPTLTLTLTLVVSRYKQETTLQARHRTEETNTNLSRHLNMLQIAEALVNLPRQARISTMADVY